jgi:hypothetical protein
MLRETTEEGLAITAPAVVPDPQELESAVQRVLARVPPIITLPRAKQRCPYTGQSRTSLLELVAPCDRNGHRPPVKAIYRRSHKYAVRGRWLIPAENLFRYLLSLAEDSAETYSKLAVERKAQRGTE